MTSKGERRGRTCRSLTDYKVIDQRGIEVGGWWVVGGGIPAIGRTWTDCKSVEDGVKPLSISIEN